jgi:hypothetical protein
MRGRSPKNTGVHLKSKEHRSSFEKDPGMAKYIGKDIFSFL